MKLSYSILVLLCTLIPSTLQGQRPDSLLIRGVDISFVQQIEDIGGKYYLNGVARDVLDIFKENGVNYVRLRLWHTPSNGYCGTGKTIEYAKRVKAKGFKLCLDFHYSDSWADPGQQTKPAAWTGLSFSVLKDSVYQYTKSTLEAFKSQNVLPDIVQIGNEITAGMLWPDGQVPTSNPTLAWQQFGELLKKGIQGAKDAASDTTIKIMIHIDRGGDNTTARWFFDNLQTQGVVFDIIGLSYYPWWHGSFTQVHDNLNDLAVRYGKDIIIAETAYPWTTSYLNDGMSNVGVNTANLPTGYGVSPQGQKAFLFALKKIIKETTNNKCIGWIYWEPAYISVPPLGSSWEHITTFDFNAHAQSTLTAFMNFDTINTILVKLRLNTATNPDTLKPSGVLQLRGEVRGLGSNFIPDGVLTTWDANSQLLATNVNSDYWERNLTLYSGDSLVYKMWTGHSSTKQTYWNIGSEGKVLAYDNSNLGSRLFIAGMQDTILPVQYYSNSLTTSVQQYWSPFEVKQDSIGILFRVNLSGLISGGLFDPTTQGPVVVRGDSSSSAGILSWNSDNIILTREPIGVASASFWSRVCYFPKNAISEGSQIQYKYYIANSSFGGWESNIPNRSFIFPKSDSTLGWQFFNNKMTPTSIEEGNIQVPNEVRLYQNYPNPFNPSTSISYTIAHRSDALINIYNILGQKIITLVDAVKNPGNYIATWNGTDNTGKVMPSGIYIVRLTVEGRNLSQKIILLK